MPRTRKKIAPIETEWSTYTIDNPDEEPKLALMETPLKQWAWKVAKSIIIVVIAAALAEILKALEIQLAMQHPALLQATLSVIVAALKQAIKLVKI